MLYWQSGPAETTDFMILGFGVIFLTMLIHVVSLYVRNSNLKKDMSLLEEIEKREDGA